MVRDFLAPRAWRRFTGSATRACYAPFAPPWDRRARDGRAGVGEYRVGRDPVRVAATGVRGHDSPWMVRAITFWRAVCAAGSGRDAARDAIAQPGAREADRVECSRSRESIRRDPARMRYRTRDFQYDRSARWTCSARSRGPHA